MPTVIYFRDFDSKEINLDMSELIYPLKKLQIFFWLEFVIMTLQPFSLVENVIFRKYFRQESISVNTFYTHMEMFMVHVEGKSAVTLPERFDIVFDGWSTYGTHYVGIFESFPGEKGGFEGRC